MPEDNGELQRTSDRFGAGEVTRVDVVTARITDLLTEILEVLRRIERQRKY